MVAAAARSFPISKREASRAQELRPRWPWLWVYGVLRVLKDLKEFPKIGGP